MKRRNPSVVKGWFNRCAEGVFGEETAILYGQRRLTVQGCRKILHYGSKEIRLQLKEKIMSVEGENLRCTAFSGMHTTVQGKIFAIRFSDLHSPAPREMRS